MGDIEATERPYISLDEWHDFPFFGVSSDNVELQVSGVLFEAGFVFCFLILSLVIIVFSYIVFHFSALTCFHCPEHIFFLN